MRILLAFLCGFLLAFAAPRVCAQVDDHNPIGAIGTFEGIVTTACAYNVLNHSTSRAIDDIVVPGAIGKYRLKMRRYYVSRDFGDSRMGPGWRHEYSWSVGQGKVEYPNGNIQDSYCEDPVGVSDSPVPPGQYTNGAFRLADGGTVVWDNQGRASQIIDPYGQTTTITYATDAHASWMQVTEPGGRYLYFTYTQQPNSAYMLHEVDAYDGRGNLTGSVIYTYNWQSTGGSTITRAMCLTRADYSDGTFATYSYETDNVPEQPTRGSIRFCPPVSTCNDVRYHGPMRRIAYDYDQGGPHGAITAERYSSGDGVKGLTVSSISPALPPPLSGGDVIQMPTDFTETRGDGPTRTFSYTSLHVHRDENGACPILVGPAPSQFLQSYTDFRGQTTYLGYDANWYVNSVQDANNHTTYYTRGPNIGEILTITHPGGSHIDYTYDDQGHYVHSISNERQKITTYTRDPTTHLVTRIDYPQDAYTPASYEEFTYNNFGQVITHHLKNGAWEAFSYDGRGLLTDKYNPKSTVPGGSDPRTHYTYYTSGPWTDRVQTMALPANTSNKAATETYEYDRALSGGVTNLNGAAVAGRGLVTKITHTAPESKYLQFKYDAYGNKVWEDNELGKITQYTYDDYNRLLSATDPLSDTTRYDYAPTQGNTTQAQQHTSNSPYWITMPTGILTHNIYDENWRKTSATAASGTLNLTTSFIYDPVGNLTDVTDPRGKVTHNVYDNRNRKTSTTEAYGTNIAATTVWHYDAASNINQIDRPDGIHETKVFDALNRMISHTVPRQVPGPSPTPAPINLITHYYYNPAGTIDHVTDPRGKVTSFQYNPSDEKTRMTYHDGSYQQWVWDNAHNLASRTTVNGETQSFTYDNRNRKTGMSWSNNADSATFTYYDDGRLNIASNPNSTVTRSYDDAGHLTLDQQNVTGLSSAKSVNYPSYDGDGRLLQMNVAPTPSPAYNYTYGYDGAGRLTTITPTGGSVLFRYAYDASSNETDRYAYLPNSVTIDQIYARDSLDRMASRLVKKGTATFSTEAYTYDHMNRITEVNRGGVADDFGFYWDGELLSAQYGGGPHSPYQEGQDPDLDTTDNIDPNAGYQPPDTEAPEPTAPPDDYSDLPVGGFVPPALPGGRSVTYYVDRAGNRQQVTDSSNPTATYAANNINQYSSVSGCSITNGLEHEVSSFQGPTDPGAVTYTYINDEHLKQVSDTSGDTYYLYYDALARCVKRTLIIPAPASINTTTTTTYYIYDGDKPIVEYSSTGIVGRNVYGKGIDEVLMRTDPGVNNGYAFYYAQDHEGSVTHLLDGRSTPSSQTGNVIEKYNYDAFGAPTFYDANNTQIYSTAYDNRFLFTGREYAASYPGTYVPAFTFYEYRARAYNPVLGRFVSEDPKGFDAGDYNLFRYCHNDPIDMTDPMGTDFHALAGHITPELLDYVTKGLAPTEAYARVMGLVQNAMSSLGYSAISIGSAGQQLFKGLGAIIGQIGRPEPSKYRAGEPYMAVRTPRNIGTEEKNGKFVNLTDWSIQLFDKRGPLPGVDVSETNVEHLAQRHVATTQEWNKWTQRTNEYGFVPNPDHWKQSFTTRTGFDTIRQTLMSGGNKLQWSATQSPSGVDVYTHQTGYFLQPGTPGY